MQIQTRQAHTGIAWRFFVNQRNQDLLIEILVLKNFFFLTTQLVVIMFLHEVGQSISESVAI